VILGRGFSLSINWRPLSWLICFRMFMTEKFKKNLRFGELGGDFQNNNIKFSFHGFEN
jgi:hypothetical protein